MRRPLNEQIDRMYHLMKMNKKLFEEFNLKKTVNPADIVSDDVKEFFSNLENIDEPLYQQSRGNYEYKKNVETVQIGLILLGYPLPRFGVDGLFGPETAQAVNKFKEDYNITDKTIEENTLNEATLEAPVPIIKVTSPFGKERSYEKHPGVDLRASSGTEIKSPADGKVIDARFKEGACGGTIQIEHPNGFVSRYCHCKDIRVNIGDTVKQGQVVGLSGGNAGDKGAGNSKNAHLHFELKKNGTLVNPLDYIGTDVGTIDTKKTSSNSAIVTPEMIAVMLEKLKKRGITSDELKSYTTNVRTKTKIDFNGDWVEISKGLLKKYEGYSQNANWDENSFRGGYGTDKKLVGGKLEKASRLTTWTKQEAEETLEYEIKYVYAPIIANQLGTNDWNKLNDKQKASLLSLGYNVGPNFLSTKDYGRKIKDAILNDDMESAARFIETGPTRGSKTGRFYNTLQRRRKEEANIFMS